MLLACWEYQKWLLEQSNLSLMWFPVLKIVEFIFTKNVNFCPGGSFSVIDPSGDIFDMLDNEIHWDSVVSETRNDNIRINHCWLDEVSEWVLYELVVLEQHTFNAPSSFSGVPFQSSAQPDVIIASNEYLVSHQVPDSRIVESHQPFEQNDVGRIGISWIGKPFVLNEGVLRNWDSLVAFLHLFECIIGQVEIQGVWMVEVVLGCVGVFAET